MLKKSEHGFSLVELLMVIAIIGILSAVVTGSLATSRGRAANASIKSSLANARPQAELFYDTNGSSGYLGVCGSANSTGGEESIQKFINSANDQSPASGTTPGYTTSVSQTNTTISVCHSNAADWAISVPLKAPETLGATTYYYYCVDSRGTSSNRVNPIGSTGAVICPAT